MEKPKVFVGIDYSMTSPSVCVYTLSDVFTFEHCKIYYIASNPGKINKHPNLIGILHHPYSCNEERFNTITWWVLGILIKYDIIGLAIEDYAFGAKGRVFHIGEFVGQLKLRLWEHKIKFNCIPPTVIKKYATNRGNADKLLMINQFYQDTQLDIDKIIGTDRIKDKNPTSDIVDSYYVCKYAWSLGNAT